MNTQLKMLACLGTLCISTSTFAATTWTLNSATVTGGGSTVTAASSGWADTGTGSPRKIEMQVLTQWDGGWGINNLDACPPGVTTGCDRYESGQPEHAIDNNQRYEMVMLSFSKAVNLTSAMFGWKQTDWDYTVLAYTGEVGGAGIGGKKWSSLAASGSGWSLVGNYAGAGTVSSATAQNFANSTYSSFWLIGAYNPLAGTTSAGLNTGNDYFKLASVSGNICSTSGCGGGGGKVPEPTSLALMAVGLLGLVRIGKRLQA